MRKEFPEGEKKKTIPPPASGAQANVFARLHSDLGRPPMNEDEKLAAARARIFGTRQYRLAPALTFAFLSCYMWYVRPL